MRSSVTVTRWMRSSQHEHPVPFRFSLNSRLEHASAHAVAVSLNGISMKTFPGGLLHHRTDVSGVTPNA